MPIEVCLWNISSDHVQKIEYSPIDSEKKLENILCSDLSVLDDDLLLIGRQVPTSSGKYIDMLAMDSTGKLTVIELKKSRTPRDVIAQVLDYASWVADLSYTDVKAICDQFHQRDFESLFDETFGIAPPEKINQEHDMMIVCSELDNESERILNYLSENYHVPINAVFFRFFADAGAEYLSRSWLIDPREAEGRSGRSRTPTKGEPWNGRDFVVNLDVCDGVSTWEDAREYGFISAGGGTWYSKTLKNLFPGARIFAMIPGKGYVGVGTVLAESVPIRDFCVMHEGREVAILDVPLVCEGVKHDPGDPERCEYFVRVEWSKTSPEDGAFWTKGLRANQNSAFKLRNTFTLERLVEHFGMEEG